MWPAKGETLAPLVARCACTPLRRTLPPALLSRPRPAPAQRRLHCVRTLPRPPARLLSPPPAPITDWPPVIYRSRPGGPLPLPLSDANTALSGRARYLCACVRVVAPKLPSVQADDHRGQSYADNANRRYPPRVGPPRRALLVALLEI